MLQETFDCDALFISKLGGPEKGRFVIAGQIVEEQYV